MSSPNMSGKEVIKVRLLRAGKVIRSYKIRSDTFSIGSEKGCTIRAAGDPSVSPKHATIYSEDGELTIVPEPNAVVLLNGEQVDFGVPGPDDIIKIGRLTFKVELGQSLDSIAPPLKKSEPAQPAAPFEKPISFVKKTQAMPVVKPVEAPVVKPVAKPVEAPVVKPVVPAKPIASSLPKPVVPSVKPAAAATVPKKVLEPEKPKMGLPSVADIIENEKIEPSSDAKIGEDVLNHEIFQRDEDEPATEFMRPLGELAYLEESEPKVAKPAAVESYAPPGIKGSEALSKDIDSSLVQYTPGDEFWTKEDIDYYLGEDEDDELTFKEPFSLASVLFKKTARKPAQQQKKETYCVAQVVRVVNGRVAETFGVLPGKPYLASNGEVDCYIDGSSAVRIGAKRSLDGELVLQGSSASLKDQKVDRGMYRAAFSEGDNAVIEGEKGTYRIEAYRPAFVNRTHSVSFHPAVFVAMGIAAVIHLLAIIAVASMPTEGMKKETEVAKTFADIEMPEEEEEIIEEPEKEEPVKKKRPKTTKQMAEKVPEISNNSLRKRIKRHTNVSENTSVDNLLNVLNKNTGKAGKSDNLKDNISNIDALPSSTGSGSFSIAGAIASLPGEGVNIAKSGGGGDFSTLSGDQVAGKGTGVSTLSKSKKKGKVRGKVTKMSSGAKVKGSLSMADVSRVVNSHIHAVQACYERELIHNPGLSGRIAFDWTVTKTGKVKGVRVRSSTLGSAKVAACISKQIKRWKFPRPKGGDVTITYPFLFRSVQ